VTIFFVVAWAADDIKPDFAELERQLFEAFRNKDYSKALNIAEMMHQLNPGHLNTLYNIAILYSKLGDKDKAYEWFEKAVDTGGLRSFRQSYFERYIAMLEHKDRDAYQKPDQIMAALALKPGERVADIGAGSGYFTIRIAKSVGEEGTVWAIDIEQEMLDYIEQRLKKEKLKNIKRMLVPPDDPQLPQDYVDTILLVHTYAYIQNRTEYAKKLRAALAPGGRVIIIEYLPSSWKERPWGPLSHQQVSRETADAEMAEAGFKPVRIHHFLPGQYFVEYVVKN
jgi:protein-L-isoaspartate O-methyltransferase